jgi:hypothetical protein
MLPTKPKSNPQKRPPKKIKVLQIRKSPRQSFFAEYFYQVLAILFGILTLFCKGMNYRWDESVVIALWIVGILFVSRQAWRLVQGDAAPAESKRKEKEKEKKKIVLGEPVKNYKPPEVPRLSKDFSHEPPRGVKGYPPPSPFIKPPK